jgi:hypothetical protein
VKGTPSEDLVEKVLVQAPQYGLNVLFGMLLTEQENATPSANEVRDLRLFEHELEWRLPKELRLKAARKKPHQASPRRQRRQQQAQAAEKGHWHIGMFRA